MGWLSKVLKVLGKLTDVLVKGRQAGLWDKGHGPNVGNPPSLGSPHDPGFPDVKTR